MKSKQQRRWNKLIFFSFYKKIKINPMDLQYRRDEVKMQEEFELQFEGIIDKLRQDETTS